MVTIMLLLVPLVGVMPNAQTIRAQVSSLPEPTNFYIDLINADDVILLWDELNDPNVDGVIVLKTEEVGEKPVEYKRLPLSESSFIDSEVEVGKTYTYQIATYGEGFINGESELKTVVISKANEPGETLVNSGLEALGAKDTVTTAAADLISPESENFWQNLVAINLLVFGFLMIVYLILYSVFVDRAKRKEQFEGINLDRKTSRVKLKLQSDHEHPDIVETAKDSYYGDKKRKLSEWVGAALRKS